MPTRWYAQRGPARRALLLAALSLGLAGPARAQPTLEPLPALQVAEHVWFVQGEAALGSPANRNFISNAAFIDTEQGVVVIDALGSPALARALLATIRLHTPRPIRYVIVTHYHADHIYGLQVLKAEGATILAHAEGREYLGSDTAEQRLVASRETLAPWIDAQTRLVPADRWLAQDLTLPMGDETLQIRHVGPAHTAEDLVVYAERAGVLFAGDLVFRGRIPYVGQADSRAWIDALERLIALQPRRLLPGHGPMSEAPQADLQLTRDYLRYLRERMGRAAAEMEPFEEAYANTDWSAFEHLPLFRAANRINAYNTYLLMERQGLPPRP
ncbi:MBL fold metallo-hydrolase [Aquabacterium sp.]|uniref:MBL fold metallo-hydrolase n=1 Tax=Aquabacterium sp. TaxID=1872578 RepID=UPI00378518DD